MALAVLAALCREFHETLVQREIVTDGVAPALVLTVAVVRKVLGDVVVDAVQRQSLIRSILDGHGDERNVRIRRLHSFHLIVSIIRVRLVRLDRPRGDSSDGLWSRLGTLAHLERFLERQTNLSLATLGVRCDRGGALLGLCGARRSCFGGYLHRDGHAVDKNTNRKQKPMLAENNKALVFMGEHWLYVRRARRSANEGTSRFHHSSADFFRSRFNKVMMRAFYTVFAGKHKT